MATAASVGLLDRGVVADRERGAADDDDLEALRSADLVTVTGGIGYVGARTLRTVVEADGDDVPWIAALSLRWLDFDPIAERLQEIGLVTERVPRYCVSQRRCAEERRAAVRGLRRRGLDPSAELRADAHFAELFVLRPPRGRASGPDQDVSGSLAG